MDKLKAFDTLAGMALTLAAVFGRELLVRLALVALVVRIAAPLALALSANASDAILWCTSHGFVFAAAEAGSAKRSERPNRPAPSDICLHAACGAGTRLRGRPSTGA